MTGPATRGQRASEVDVVIVGSGATGSLLAARLGEAGRKVMVLEAGPARTLSSLYSSTVWSRALRWKGAPVSSEGPHPVAYGFEAGWGTGGSALHHYAVWLRLHANDFKLHSIYGKGLDWPIEYSQLRPYYDQLQREVGLAGDARREVWRPPGDEYPMPALTTFGQAELIAAGFDRLDKRVAPLPMAINSVSYQGRPACIQDGWCDAGCPTGALANPIVLYGKRMRDAGVTLRTEACVRTIVVDARGTRATGVVYADSLGRQHTVRAKLVVLAAFSVQTPRLLLNSVHARHPKGLGNNAGLVGRYFAAHGAVNIYSLFEEPTFSFMGRTGGQLLSQEDYLAKSADGYLGSRTWRIGQSLKLGDLGGIANTRPELMGPELAQFMQRAPQHIATMNALVDNPASRTNSISLSSDKDSQGLPLARIAHELSADTLRCLADATEEGKRIFKAAGAAEVWAAPYRTEHLMGGTIMGTRADNSVTDQFGAVHGIENLYIAGTGLFPSVGAVNPTFTAMALAARTAEHINREWPSMSA